MARICMDGKYVMEKLEEHRGTLVERAQTVVNEWDWRAGGACTRIANEICYALDELENIDAYTHGELGGDHTWVVIPVGDDVIEVDIPWTVYEEMHGFGRYVPTHREIDVDDIEFTFLKLDPKLLELEYA